MITIFDSRTITTTASAQMALNCLVEQTDTNYWDHIVYDPDSQTTQVKEIWVSDKVYITKTTASSPMLKVVHTNTACVNQAAGDIHTAFLIIKTDSGIIIRRAASGTMANKQFIAVGITSDPNGIESKGVIGKLATGSTIRSFLITNNMSTTVDYHPCDNVEAAATNTVLIPVYSLSGNEHFTELLMVNASKATDGGEILLNNQKYYIYGSVALPYT